MGFPRIKALGTTCWVQNPLGHSPTPSQEVSETLYDKLRLSYIQV